MDRNGCACDRKGDFLHFSFWSVLGRNIVP